MVSEGRRNTCATTRGNLRAHELEFLLLGIAEEMVLKPGIGAENHMAIAIPYILILGYAYVGLVFWLRSIARTRKWISTAPVPTA